MCLIALAYDVSPHRLVVAANRDEFHARPAAPAHFWPDAPDLLAGRDLLAGGTWMGITRTGRFAAVTNYREPEPPPADAPSRGGLTAGFLTGTASAEDFARSLAGRGDRYAGFNLLVGDAGGLYYVTNRHPGWRRLSPGVYGISNHLLDTDWPKVRDAKEALSGALSHPVPELEAALFAALAREAFAPDHALPDTGVGIEVERVLSSPFIRAGAYGTRASTVLTVGPDGAARLVERTVDPAGGPLSEVVHAFALSAPTIAPR
jgi:uncharacterized protein with NRDE domain